MVQKNEPQKKEKRINPVYEYLMQLRGKVFVNDPMLLA